MVDKNSFKEFFQILSKLEPLKYSHIAGRMNKYTYGLIIKIILISPIWESCKHYCASSFIYSKIRISLLHYYYWMVKIRIFVYGEGIAHLKWDRNLIAALLNMP